MSINVEDDIAEDNVGNMHLFMTLPRDARLSTKQACVGFLVKTEHFSSNKNSQELIRVF